MNGLSKTMARRRVTWLSAVCALLLLCGAAAPGLSSPSPVAAQGSGPEAQAVLSPLVGLRLDGRMGSLSPAGSAAVPPQQAPSLLTPSLLASSGTRPGLARQFEELSYYLQDTDFVSRTLGWAAGYPHWDQAARAYTGTLLMSDDGGATWHRQAAGTDVLLRAVDFVDATHGWAVGANGTVLRTTNGGVDWQQQAVPTSDELMDVAFVDTVHGWATSVKPTHTDSWGEADDWEAAMWHTANGGVTWTRQSMPAGASILHAVRFLNAQQGWAVGVRSIGDDVYGSPDHRAAVYHTVNGGQTWSVLYAPDLEISLTCVDFVDGDHGWVGGFPTVSSLTGGALFATSDGGATWERQEPGAFFAPLWDVAFLDRDRGYAVGADYISAWGPPVWRTLDGGTTWEKVAMARHENDALRGVAVSEDRVVALGEHDYVVTSTDPWGVFPGPNGEDLFTQTYINTHYRFEDVAFTDAANGWVVGSYKETPELSGQVILHTKDGGATWGVQYQDSPDPDVLFSYHRLDSVVFVDAQRGWAVGTSRTTEGVTTSEHHGAILHTSDGGLHWEEQGQELYADYNLEFFDVQFLDALEGWALATDKFPNETVFLAHTVDGGATWGWVDTGVVGSMAIGFELVQGALHFTDAEHGWAAGGLGTVVQTSDGGASWTRQVLDCGYPSCPIRIYGVQMLDAQTGWLGGEDLYGTTDGGAHWTPTAPVLSGDIQDLQFVDAQNGWMAGDGGDVVYTRNGGESWRPVASGAPSTPVRGLSFLDADRGWAVGDYGVILTTVQVPYWPVFVPLVMRSSTN